MKRLCVDKKSVGKGRRYMTIVSHLNEDHAHVAYITEDRTKESLARFLRTSRQSAGRVWQPYPWACGSLLPGRRFSSS